MTPTALPPSLHSSAPVNQNENRDKELFKAAQDLEASFLAEMLKSAGFGKSREANGGGIGEDQFSSFLRQEHAKEMIKTGGIGLAQSLFEALKERADAE